MATPKQVSSDAKQNETELNQQTEFRLKIAKLKQKKSVIKSSLTKAKNKMLNMLDEESTPKEIRDSMDQVSSLQSKAIDIIYELSVLYKNIGELENVAKTCAELDKVGDDIEESLEVAKVFLKSDTSSVESKSVKSGLVRLFQSQTDQKVESTDISTDRSFEPHRIHEKHQRDIPPVGAGNIEISSKQSDIGKDMWKQLKRVSIPVFSGNVKFYESWKAAFMACVDRAPATNEYKLLQLRQYLSGEPAEIVGKLGHSAQAYDVGLERLERKYGGRRRQIALKMEEIANFRPLRPGNAKDLENFADMLDVAVVSLTDADKVEELGDGCLYLLLLKKMTASMITRYKRWIFELDRLESVETLREWILQEADFQTVASEIKLGVLDKSKSGCRDRSKSEAFFGAKQNGNRKKSCSLCQAEKHEIWNCAQFKSLDVPKRWDKAKQLRLCFRCLGSNHSAKFCTRTIRCGIDGCQATHNRMLHGSSKLSTESELEGLSDDETNNAANVTMSSSKQLSGYSALRTVPVVVKHGSRKLTVNCLLDDASTNTYINEAVASELGLQGDAKRISVNVLNNKTEIFDSRSVELGLESLNGQVDIVITALTVPKVTGNLKVINWRNCGKRWKHLKHIDFPKVGPRPVVDLLIGMDNIELHRAIEEVVGSQGEPIARLTPLGWTCVGQLSDVDEQRSHFGHSCFTCSQDCSSDSGLDQLLQKFREVEHVPSQNQILSKDERTAVESVRSSLVHTENGYKVGVPWKDNATHLPSNYDAAFSRLCSTKRKLLKDEKVAVAYEQVISDYLKKGYIRKVPQKEIKDGKWYLPHFAVLKPDRATTKVRIVFDASAKAQGVSLNDVIFQGPKLQNDLFEILVRFRRYPVAVICDIAEMYMYLQIHISESDRPYFRFLWRSMDQKREPEVYEFSRVVFGMNASPFMAQFVSQEHARAHASQLPLAAETVLKSTYMDDNIDSVESDEKAEVLLEQLTELWSSAGMHARKWVSNSETLLQRVPVEDRLSEINLQMSELPSVKALGLKWSAAADEFRFDFEEVPKEIKMTKRNFLRQLAKLFDPLGLITPFSIRAKAILQEIWLSGANWDDEVSPCLQQKALKWYSEIHHLTTVRVPRCIQLPLANEEKNLHVFVDASQQAYGTAIYTVSESYGVLSSTLVASKGHVAPLKAVSVPRLELMAAVLGVKLANIVAKSLSVPQDNVTFWSDSQNVLWWIKQQSRSLKQFVANRVRFIQEHSLPSQWKYVPSGLNAADILTRGVKVDALKTSKWLNGPSYLVQNESNWPEQKLNDKPRDSSETKKPVAQVVVTMQATEQEDEWRLEPSRYSDWTHLCRVHAWVYRFLCNSRVPVKMRKLGELDLEETIDAENKLLTEMQKQAFIEEYAALTRGKQLPKDSKVLSLKPFLDDSGVMRVGGRLSNADVLSFDAQHPVVLPRHNWITALIVKHYHNQCGHFGTNYTLSALSTRYWIVAAREEIRDWEIKCAWCQRQKAKPAQQLMADLPKVRVKCSLRAFDQTGVDFAGPFVTKQGRGRPRQKRYLCLFTCLSTRAVHLEIAFGLDTDSFLNALFRMMNRRGVPREIVSDNGTNFVGAAKELQALVAGLNSETIKRTMVKKGIVWRFNPPHAPHFGGVFESLIKSAKRAIFSVLSAGDLSDEELMTAFSGAESLLNSRPLTYQSAHPNDDVPLTPNHFLHGQAGGEFAAELDGTSFNPHKRWRRVQELVSHVRKRWMREWLSTLNTRKKWSSPSKDVQVDDVVVVVSQETARSCWPLGRVVQTYPGKDGHVRVVDIQVGNAKLTRPVTKVCPLEWN